jgi:uncharacterized protein (DUF2235 family)
VQHVQTAYAFLAINYVPGDEIFLIGFSRGAMIARSVAALIDDVGLLTRKGLESISEIMTDFQHRNDPNYRPKYPNNPFPGKPSAGNPAYQRELQKVWLNP